MRLRRLSGSPFGGGIRGARAATRLCRQGLPLRASGPGTGGWGAAPLRVRPKHQGRGAEVYAHEIFVLNGALRRTTYTVSRNLFPFDPDCSGENGVFTSAVGNLRTNAAGNARDDTKVTPEEVAGFEGVHGVRWTVVQNANGALVYRTGCTAVTLD